jgi:hypothetical protein
LEWIDMACFFRFIIIMLSFCLLHACSPVHKTNYTYIPPEYAMGKMCVARCLTAKKHCEKLCKLREQNCMMKTQNKNTNSRRCQVACQCRPAFNTCYSACDGAVYEKSNR